MAKTESFMVPSGSWTEITGVANFCVLQIQSGGAAKVHVGSAEPAAGAAGIVLQASGLRELSMNSIADGELIFVRAFDSEVRVVAIHGGA